MIGLSRLSTRAPKNKLLGAVLKNKLLALSAMKIIAKSPLPYSTLNPGTSSDSPVVKSKGGRAGSATHVVSPTASGGASTFVS